jgi:uncharacterized protein YjbI with pentapeptide repeats
MAKKLQIRRLRESVEAWNRWRAEDPSEAVDLRRANLSEGRLRGVDLRGADLRGADLIGADLRGADFSRAVLLGAYLIGADLSGARLQVTDLRGVDLRGAVLHGADLAETFFLTQTQLEAAKGNRETKLPASLVHPEHWLEASRRPEASRPKR